MPLVLEDVRLMLRTLIRSIDRKADFTATLSHGDQPGVEVAIQLRKFKTSIVIPIRDLEGAAENSIQRSQLRQTIKRAIDRMTFATIPIASTKVTRGPSVDGGYFRAQQGGYRGGRR